MTEFLRVPEFSRDLEKLKKVQNTIRRLRNI